MIKTTHDGRTIRTGKHYSEFRGDLYARQKGLCLECGAFTRLDNDLYSDNSFHVDHEKGRGGGKRDDTFESCKGLCGLHHRMKHGQQSAVQSKPQWSRKNT